MIKNKIIREFKLLLESPEVNEQDCQDFLEKNSELIYTPFLLNHGLHFNSIISKFPLDTSLISDLVYLSKSSNSWNIVFVELEHPNKNFFVMIEDQLSKLMNLMPQLAKFTLGKIF